MKSVDEVVSVGFVVLIFFIMAILMMYWGGDIVADRVCSELGYDEGDVTFKFDVSCSYILDVPVEDLAPYLVPESDSGTYWSEEAREL